MFRILLVDDNPVNLDITSRMLRKAGYVIDLAADGEEAVEKAARWRYDLIVMDMAMPGIGGGEATKAIRSAEQASGMRRVPVIAFTANALEDFRQRALRSDMDYFVTKPIERRTFLAAVERSLDSRTIVLIADDDASNRERAFRQLRAIENVGAIQVATGAEALAACSRQRISFALIGETLPDMTGADLAERIRGSEHGAAIGIGQPARPWGRETIELALHALLTPA